MNSYLLFGWVYLFFVLVNYIDSKTFKVYFFKYRGVKKEVLLAVAFLCLLFIFQIFSCGFSTEPTLCICMAFILMFTKPNSILFFVGSIFLAFKIYQFVLEKFQKNRIVKLMGLLIAFFIISFSLGFKDFRVVSCQLSPENIIKTIESSTLEDCVIGIALENNEVELCDKFGILGRCYYQLALKTNDISLCEKLEERAKELDGGDSYTFNSDLNYTRSKYYAEICYNDIALIEKNLSLCKKSGNNFRNCALQIIEVSESIRNHISSGRPQSCLQESNQEEIDKCYYNFIKFYYYDTDFYKKLNCSANIKLHRSEDIFCFPFRQENKTEKNIALTEEIFIKLCGNIKNNDLRAECYAFKR